MHVTQNMPAQDPRLERPLFLGLRTIVALVLREMTSLYGNSPGGYVWAFLEPVGGIILLAFGFSLVMHAPSLGDSFFVFYATGFMPLALYLDLGTKTMNALKYSRALLAYPRVLWIDALLARMMLTSMTSFVIFWVVLPCAVIITGENVSFEPLPIIIGMSMMVTLGFGIGSINCVIVQKFEVWGRLWNILTKPIFIASGVVFLFDDLPANVQSVLWWSPLIHAIGIVRSGIYPSYEPHWVSMTYPFAVGLGCMAFGLLFLRRFHNS